MSSPGRQICSTHPQERALFVCDGCGERLCWDCIKEGAHLIFCRLCGERAIPLDAPSESQVAVEHDEPSPPEDPGAVDDVELGEDLTAGVPEDWLAAEARVDELAPSVELDAPAARAVDLLVRHTIVPAATIAMVTALLFFLLDVRSVFLDGSSTLKWIGFWFVIATVLIVRYGKVHGVDGRQGCYTLALGGATIVVMVASPWAPQEADPVGAAINLLIVALVWRFADRLTAALSPDEPWRESRQKVYGLERLRLEAWQRRTGRQPKPSMEGASRNTSPGTVVARLAVGALVLFALGEPFLLAGPPEVGGRALAAMIVFLAAGGMVMAAGSAVASAQLVRAEGGRVPLAVMPARIVAAAVVMVVLLAVAAAFPGVAFRGLGWLEPVRGKAAEHHELGDAGEAGAQETAASGDDGGPDERARGPSEAPPRGDDSSLSRQASASRAVAIPQFFSGLGRLLFIPMVVAFVLGGLWLAARHWRAAAALGRSWRDRLRDWLADRFELLRRLLTWRRAAATTGSRDPFAALEGLRRLAPEAAIVSAYERLTNLLDRLGYPRPDRQTPHEYLNGLPAALRPVDRHLQVLTTLYVKTIYSAEAADESDREKAAAILDELRSWWQARQRA